MLLVTEGCRDEGMSARRGRGERRSNARVMERSCGVGSELDRGDYRRRLSENKNEIWNERWAWVLSVGCWVGGGASRQADGVKQG